MKNVEKKKEEQKTALHQENLYQKNRWDFAKKVTKGTLHQDQKFPSFRKTDADHFYPTTYSLPKVIQVEDLNWFPMVPRVPQDPGYTQFNLEPIKPRDVRSVLKNANQKSSPGPDGIPYSVLYKFHSTHHILATLYNKILVSGVSPRSWSESVIKLIHKKGPINDATNF